MERIVVNRTKELLAIKSRREQRRITIRDIESETGLDKSVVHRWLQNEVRRIDLHVLEGWCNYLDCEPGDILVRETVEKADESPEIINPELLTA
ncbi:helix-turn-helix transcriptional regulator [Phototrophicus methaneseepsis]|uniref:Helix-turn-helix transcriptional regulator n=1 Tax=Phototrophicus methaneseepsis TaxID=2710758 RepID=A0A7S8IDR5_9CHLR|nr:helix-turn-helix transcriptional regulator [Phototrophicus methaneseepsis]QPC81088.1 helix-turn-helix transcriptional regulator [Phototrophicus methaneseepsis]